MMEPKQIKVGALIELRDEGNRSWLPLTIISIADNKVTCEMLTGEPIFTTMAALITDARLRPHDGSCADCGYEAHDGPCVERICSECGVEVSSRCSQHPQQPVHVYRRIRYLAEIVNDKPYPTREWSRGIRNDLVEQMRVLRNAEQPRQSRVMITVTERADILSAIENAIKLIDSLPTEKRGRS